MLRHQRIVGPPIRQRRIQIFPVDVTRERSRFADQPVHDVPVVDLMFALPTQPRHALHHFAGIPDLDLLQPNPRFHFFAHQPRRYRVGVVFDPDGAPAPNRYLLAHQRLQPLRWQRSQRRQLLGQLGRPAGIPPRLHGLQQLLVLLPVGKIPATAQQQRLLHCLLEMPMRRLDVTILMPAGRVGGLRLDSVMTHERPIVVCEVIRLAVGMHRQGHAIRPMPLRRRAQGPQRVL